MESFERSLIFDLLTGLIGYESLLGKRCGLELIRNVLVKGVSVGVFQRELIVPVPWSCTTRVMRGNRAYSERFFLTLLGLRLDELTYLITTKGPYAGVARITRRLPTCGGSVQDGTTFGRDTIALYSLTRRGRLLFVTLVHVHWKTERKFRRYNV